MKSERSSDGSLKLELSAREARTLKYLAERATFVDTPPEEQEEILRLAEKILEILGVSSDR